MGVSKAEQLGPRLPGCPNCRPDTGLYVVDVAVGHKDPDALQSKNPLVGQIRPPAIAVAGHIGDRNVGKTAGEFLCVPGQIAHMENPIRPLQPHHVLHIGHVSVGVGKKNQLHVITFPERTHRMR